MKKTPFSLFLILVGGVLLFQAQKYWGDVPESDHRFDQPTREYFQKSFPSKLNDQVDVITTPDGYDNFDIGLDYAEMHISQNPKNPLQMFFGVNNSSSGLNHRYTINGYDWSVSTLSYPGGTCCDPWTAVDSAGNLFYSALANGNYVAKSTNFGQSFLAWKFAVSGGDRNTIAVDFTNGPYSGNVYAMAWSPNANFGRSTDGGNTWQTTVSGTPNTTPGNMICVGPSPDGTINGGSVYFVTITGSNPAPSTFNFFRSTNGGANFTQMSSAAISPGYVGTLNSSSRLVINNARTRPYPMIACDNSNGPYRGRLYCVYASNVPDGNGNKPDIKLQYSTNGGANWSTPVVVNDNANASTSDQWYPAVWCDHKTGKLYIKWYDTRNNPASYQTDVYATYTTNGGQTFAANQRLTNVSSTYPCPSCAANTNCYRGDYDAIVSNGKTSFAVWYDPRNCTYQNMGSYFPDFAMKFSPAYDSMSTISDSTTFMMTVPSVKLYTDTVLITAAVTPAPTTGTFVITYPNGQRLTSYPDSLRVRVRTSGGVTAGTYTLTVTAAGPNGTPVHKRTSTLYVSNIVGITGTSEQPEDFKLYQNYPNPFNPSTTIGYSLKKSSNVKISIYDLSGKSIAVYNRGIQDAGRHNFVFRTNELSSGIYFYRLEAGEFVDVKSMTLLK